METNKTSKVLKCEFKKTWPGKGGGTNYDYNVELENGESGIYSSYGKENSILNQEITYTVVENGSWGNKIRLVTNNNSGKTGFGRPKNEKSISAQSAMKAAVELCCHNKIELGELKKYALDIFNWQNHNVNFRMTKKPK